jgi:putative sigma-54 modulation protein
MDVKISFKHLEHTEALDEKIQKKSKKIAKILDGKIDIHWTCGVSQGKHVADVKIIGPSFEYHAHGSSDNLYKTLDLVMSKVMKQIRKKKDKWKNRISKQASENPKVLTLKQKQQEEEAYQQYLEEEEAA